MATFKSVLCEKVPELLENTVNASIITVNSVVNVVPKAVDKTVNIVGTTADMVLDYLNAGNQLSAEFLAEFNNNAGLRVKERRIESRKYYVNSIMSKIEDINKYPENIRYELFLTFQRDFGKDFVHWDNQNKVIVLHKIEG